MIPDQIGNERKIWQLLKEKQLSRSCGVGKLAGRIGQGSRKTCVFRGGVG